ncbi:selenium metabolism membrane protein YedE/FdhT [Poseidonibacter lekithochrous]|uniref:selenium metabolism membrane protein YedE/FdhT n=1 Tax=Poseidonibacter TaxID=2321187 RepID=UPI001C09A6E5|nr:MULTISPECIES: selenium metabolism membrane protein YedE/FdhT [Poseidonibacter]MBU3015221.1 selenium metabolism membrane protein YedE/FdhT [Poseidonibacter lekithochrous]MDO6828519.1 selenium metabolism membrane protein YedE/FdhT [Poseidonibacter sp. 1_MG-2023]
MNYFKQFKEKYLVAFWRPTPAVIALGVLAAYYFGITGTYWAVTGEFTRWGGHILQLAGVDISDWGYYKIMNMNGNSLTRVDGVMIIGMFAGCIAAAFWGNNVKLRMPASKIRIAQALIGGIIAGFGARLGMGCNLASLFTGIPQFSAHAWFFTLAMIIGVYLGTKVTMLSFFQSKIKLEKVSCSKDLNKNSDESKQKVKSLFTIGSFVFVAMIIWALYLIFIVNSQKLGIAMLFGAAFGLLIAKAQICFTSAFRDIFTTGRSELAIAIVIGMAVSTIGVFSYIMIGTPAKIMWAGPNAIIGGLLFGFGIVLAGGCECGWMYRAVEGQVHFWIVGIGNVIGATLLAFMWDGFSLSLATSWPKINLLESFGQYGGLFMNYIFLFLLFLLILKLEKNYRIKLQKKGN